MVRAEKFYKIVVMTKIIEWFGTVASIAGSFIVAFHMFTLGYIFFLAGAVAWLYIGFKFKNKPLIALNVAFTIANLIGLYNAIL